MIHGITLRTLVQAGAHEGTLEDRADTFLLLDDCRTSLIVWMNFGTEQSQAVAISLNDIQDLLKLEGLTKD